MVMDHLLSPGRCAEFQVPDSSSVCGSLTLVSGVSPLYAPSQIDAQACIARARDWLYEHALARLGEQAVALSASTGAGTTADTLHVVRLKPQANRANAVGLIGEFCDGGPAMRVLVSSEINRDDVFAVRASSASIGDGDVQRQYSSRNSCTGWGLCELRTIRRRISHDQESLGRLERQP
jgi:hypothetical protein